MFFGIRIKESNAYLTIVGNNGKDEFKWGKEKDSLTFGSVSGAENFAKSYFKKFKNWEVVELDLEFE